MQLTGYDIPVRLTQICSSWRMLALDTRELWSSVTLVLNQTLARNTSAITKLADYWLAKGQRGRLALEINMGMNVERRRIDLEPVGQLLTAWASDWRNLTIVHCPDKFELHAFSTVGHTRFEALATLPHHRTVSFRTFCTPSIYHTLTLLFLPWSQLESLSTSTPVSGQECLNILANSSKLTILDVHVISDVPNPEFRPPVVLSKLGRLRLVSDPWNGDIEPLLGVSLTESHRPQSPFHWPRSLESPPDVRLLFLTVPNVTSLKLNPREIRLTAPDFDALRVEHLLPALARLDVAVGHKHRVRPIDSVRSAIGLLEARTTTTTGVARLGHVRFADWTDWDVDRDLSKPDPEAMAVELQRLRALKA
ncbi:hypothetical protein C8R45DRAFT_1108477 [Mycena sanguinolenta]|nr:hypothetical protein C8R45DRAFT_1108477 [Mycena sanguinolenta]